MLKISTYVRFTSKYWPCNLLQKCCRCRLKALAAWLCARRHPNSSIFDGSVPNLEINWPKHPSGLVLCIRKFLAPLSYSLYCTNKRANINFSKTIFILWNSRMLISPTFIPVSNSDRIVGIKDSTWSKSCE